MRMISGVLIVIQILFWITFTTGLDIGLNLHNEISRTRTRRADAARPQDKSNIPDLKCTLPPHTSDKDYNVTCRDSKKCGKDPGDKVPELTTLLLRCHRGYGYDRMPSRAFCINSTWVPSIKKCKRICTKLEPENVELSCYRTEDSLSVACNGSLVQGMVVRIQCIPNHHVEVPVLYNEITCKSNGEWSSPLYKCVPDCGKARAPAVKLISNGAADNFGDSLWNVAIYDVSDRKSPNQICGGTIISPHLIVSAAHCFFDDDKRKLFSAKKYEIAVGKIKRDYAIKDNSETAFYKIQEIILSDAGYSGPLTDYAADIAILRTEKKISISSAVLPACLQLDKTQRFEPGKKTLGKLVGWGYDSKNTPSDVLLTANLPFISRSDCLKKVSADFQSSISLDKFCAGSLNVSGISTSNQTEDSLINLYKQFCEANNGVSHKVNDYFVLGVENESGVCPFDPLYHHPQDKNLCSFARKGPGAKPGDSGGGLMYLDPQSKLYFLRGVVSIKDPSTSTSLAAFTDVSFFADWISKTLNKIEKSVSKS